MQVYEILRTDNCRNNNIESRAMQRQITTTIFLLTVIFFICNTAFICYPIMWCSESNLDPGDRTDTTTAHMIAMVLGMLMPILNAAANPLILIVRGEALSSFVKGHIRKRISGVTNPISMKMRQTQLDSATIVSNRSNKSV